MNLSEIAAGAKVRGLSPEGVAEVVKAVPHGSAVVDVVYMDAQGEPHARLVLASEAEEMELAQDAASWTFDGDAEAMRLTSEAYRIRLAHLFDPYLAVRTSSIEPLPHQIAAVYGRMLPLHPLRFLLADDPGAGKTVMTGLLLKELMLRGDADRCLIVCPGSLAEQWQEELWEKFHLRFEILTNDRIEAAVTGNIFTEMPRCIARLDKLARDERVQARLKASEWDIIIVDEAHKMSATVFGREVKYTRRYLLGQMLGDITRHLLLLTATPHNGKPEDFRLFLGLLDHDRFDGTQRETGRVDVSDLMRRMVKEELLKFDGSPLFPERIAYTVGYELSPEEEQLYKAVTDYVKTEFNRADQRSKRVKNNVGFALTILQRRLASSPEAIYQSLARRTKRLEALVEDLRHQRTSSWLGDDILAPWIMPDEGDEDDYDDAERDRLETEVESQATAAQTIEEMEAEIAELRELTAMANHVRQSGHDCKWSELSKLLQDDEHMHTRTGAPEKLIIFTEHKDTLRYLAQKIGSLLGRKEAVVVIHGGMRREERHLVEQSFRQDKEVRILLATDAAGEGLNLQTAHLMINYDLPWNPNRLEQRFGRIHRIGQTEVCYLWNLVAKNTREGDVFQRLFDKLEEERQALGGKVFDILGKISFDGRPLRDLLIEAIRYGESGETQTRIADILDDSLRPDRIEALMREHALTRDVMRPQDVEEIRADMERMEARKLQPHFIRSFFLAAFASFGGRVSEREPGRYEILRVPYDIKRQSPASSLAHVLPRYERVCFEKAQTDVPGLRHAELLCPGHPLLDAVVAAVLDRGRQTLHQGAVFIDDNDAGDDVRFLAYLEDTIEDARIQKTGKHRLVSQQVHYVELTQDGTGKNSGYAPYLDYRAPRPDERAAVRAIRAEETWLAQDLEALAAGYAIEHILPQHLTRVKKQQSTYLDKTEQAVRMRLRREIQYWDGQANALREKEAAGHGNQRLTSYMASRRAEELSARLARRMDEIKKERQITAKPPVLVGAALIIPRGRLDRVLHRTDASPFQTADAAARRAIELAGMEAVMEIERELGNTPRDVSTENVGYDIESKTPDGHLRFIEVKGRAAGAATITVTKNEILTALNQPEAYLLAIVEVAGDARHVTYLHRPFRGELDFAAASVNYEIKELVRQGDCVFDLDA
ncbi:helicase-related protein [uncultured Selenomonas sp.]|uniref:helicase-related protein n=1 Tax=uncultured Selenomonas sp. TaxID=159275 RepID=UPI0025FD9D2E|nr:helicase-related protein [uncultured Selenomonas sp.]